MNKFKDISYAAVVILVIVLLLQIYIYSKDNDDPLKFLDYNRDGKVTKGELKMYLKHIEEEKKRKKMELSDFKKSTCSGLIRGMLMGLILFDIEGGIVLGITLGVLNPLISSIEKNI